MNSNEFVFTGIICKDGDRYSSLCPELDVASEGDSIDEASSNILEAVTLYLETSIEANLPYLRPVPQDEDPRMSDPESVVITFNLIVDFYIRAHA